jgi:hypothetical protein
VRWTSVLSADRVRPSRTGILPRQKDGWVPRVPCFRDAGTFSLELIFQPSRSERPEIHSFFSVLLSSAFSVFQGFVSDNLNGGSYPRFIVKLPDPVHPAPLPLNTQVPVTVLFCRVPCRFNVLFPFEFTVPD